MIGYPYLKLQNVSNGLRVQDARLSWEDSLMQLYLHRRGDHFHGRVTKITNALKPWACKNIHIDLWHISIHPCPNFNTIRHTGDIAWITDDTRKKIIAWNYSCMHGYSMLKISATGRFSTPWLNSCCSNPGFPHILLQRVLQRHIC